MATKIQGRLIGHVGKVVFSPTLHLSPHNIDGTDNDIESKPSKFPKFEDHGSRRCYKKVVMVDEMKFDTVETCNHSYDKESILLHRLLKYCVINYFSLEMSHLL